jgi:hypothetical protein
VPKALFIVLVIVLTSGTPEAQQQNDGNELLTQCNAALKFVDNPRDVSGAEAEQGMYCLGLLRGILDTVSLWETSDTLFKNRVSPGRPRLPE